MISWLRAAAARLFPPRVDTTPELAAVEAEIADPWAAEVVRRALSCVGTGLYGLGSGGRDPSAPSPLGEYQPRRGEDPRQVAARRKLGKVWCDCSGFLAFAWSEPRKDSDDGADEIAGDWIYTDALARDALGPQRFARRVAIADVRPGDALVYGAGAKVGHCAIVVGRSALVWTFADLAIAHCHGPSGKGPAITRASGALWDRHDDAIAIRRVR